MKETLEKTHPQLALEWHPKRNGDLKPSDVSYASNKKVWWQCPKGHEWEAIIGNRSRDCGCPFCGGKRACSDNCLATLRADLVEEWSDRNKITPSEVTLGSVKKVFWICKLNHVWEATVSSRVKGSGCPYCANKAVLRGYNDIATKSPKLAAEWDRTKNELSPADVLYGSTQYAWWKCSKGHSWKATVEARAYGQGCPYCSGHKASSENNLEDLYPDICKWWDYRKNTTLPNSVTAKGKYNAWWICEKGHSWQARVSDMTIKQLGCPYCSGKRASEDYNLLTEYPLIAKEWNYDKNIGIDILAITPHSAQKVWWKCAKGHEWEAVVSNRTTNRTGCPICSARSTSFPEQAILFYCRRAYSSTISRDKEEIGKELDIFIPELNYAIEYDGARWHNGEEKGNADIIKDKICCEKGIKLFRIIEKGVTGLHDNSVTCIFRRDSSLTDLERCIKNLFSFFPNCSPDINIKRDQMEIIEKYTYLDVADSLAAKYPEVAKQWDYSKNKGLTPEQFSAGSGQRAWWKCEKQHSWQTSIYSRTSGSGCPQCLGIIASPENNLAVRFPSLMSEWNEEKNADIPEHYSAFSTKKVWWKCKLGHEYLMPITYKTKDDVRCPYCSGKRTCADNSLATLFPQIAKEWDYDKNSPLTPNDVVATRHIKVWWICSKGHSYQALIGARTKLNGTGCPYCNGKLVDKNKSLAAVYPELISEWHTLKNVNLTPYDVMPKSGKRVWWICSKGHEWEASIENRANGSKCPFCSGTRAKRVLNVETGELYENSEVAATKLKCSKSSIRFYCNNPEKSINGYHLKYV